MSNSVNIFRGCERIFREIQQRKLVSALKLTTFSIIALTGTGLITFAANISSVKHRVRHLLVARECRKLLSLRR
ncbi:hypothetical protein [Microcoleus vaginatus]|uniref:hypothetical protein n=1 Tax=Microcoleus vaginatus TaxID=119532 RepID=UPI00403FC13A